jgi:hypothetical protein
MKEMGRLPENQIVSTKFKYLQTKSEQFKMSKSLKGNKNKKDTNERENCRPGFSGKKRKLRYFQFLLESD